MASRYSGRPTGVKNRRSIAHGLRSASVNVAAMPSPSRTTKTEARFMVARTALSVMIDDQWPMPCCAVSRSRHPGQQRGHRRRVAVVGRRQETAHRQRDYSVPMSKGRLEAFSDGVFAVIITIMVLELKAPHGAELEAFRPLLPAFLTYVLSYVFLGIYWNNHHHLLHVVDRDQRRLAVGEPASAVLAVAGAVRHRLDGREPFRRAADRGLRAVLLHGRRRLPDPRERSCCSAGNPRLAAAIGNDSKGKLSAVLYPIAHPAGVCAPVDRRRHLRVGGADVAGARPADRTRSRKPTSTSQCIAARLTTPPSASASGCETTNACGSTRGRSS